MLVVMRTNPWARDILGNFAQVISHAVRADFRRERVEEIEHREKAEGNCEDQLPQYAATARRPVPLA